MLSCLLLGVQVKQGANAGHGEHHIPVSVFLCRVADDVAFWLCLIRRPHAIVVTGVTSFFGVLILTPPG